MNRHGLGRDIPEGIKRQVRQRDGFGCVICGKAIIDYEHFDPEFADATSHEVDGIVLLCIEHHGLKTRGILSPETIKRHMLSPKCKEIGYSFGPFDVGIDHPEITVGQIECIGVECILRFDGEELLSIRPPELPGGPFNLSAKIRDKDGNTTLEIVDNEWRANTENWDVVSEGQTITIRRGLGDIALRLKTLPPRKIIVKRLDLHHKGHHLRCIEGQNMELVTRDGSHFSAYAVKIASAKTALECDGNGIRVGVGGGSVYITNAVIRSPQQKPRIFSASTEDVLGAYNHWCWCGLRRPHSHG